MESGEGERRPAAKPRRGSSTTSASVQLEAKRYADSEKTLRDAGRAQPGVCLAALQPAQARLRDRRYDDADAELLARRPAQTARLGRLRRPVRLASVESNGIPGASVGLLAEACRRVPSEARFAIHRLCPPGKARRSGALDLGGTRPPLLGDGRVHAFCGLCGGMRRGRETPRHRADTIARDRSEPARDPQALESSPSERKPAMTNTIQPPASVYPSRPTQ